MTVSPYYSIHRYREDFYKVVAFKGVRDPDFYFYREKEDIQHNYNKLAANISRARSMVLQYALCNPWEYFFTGTLNKKKFDRYDLDTYASRLSQFIRDKRKKYNSKFQVLLVPEKHKDGAWHIHGLIQGLPENILVPFSPPAPQRLIDNGYLNWPDYMDKFGFCSLASIRDPIATAFYITKYISKDISNRSKDLGKHLYFHSRPLRKAEKASDIYIPNYKLEDYCTEDHEFCKTGMVENAPWYFPYQWEGAEILDIDALDPPEPAKKLRDPLEGFDPSTIDPFYEQTSIDGFIFGGHPF